MKSPFYPIPEERLLKSEAATQWETVGIGHHHGIVVPLFSLHSEKSCGIGEYLDLIPLINWCKQVGMDTIQLLPLNDNGHGWSPYSAISASALNPLFLSLHALGDAPSLPKPDRVDYDAVIKTKTQFLKAYVKEHGERIKKEERYQQFVEANPWLEQYASFKVLLEKNKQALWTEWKEKECTDDSEYHIIVQYLCHCQMRDVKEYATKNDLLLLGDLPILVAQNSHDVWDNPEFFSDTLAAGAPPDYYSKEGQAWGMPLYHWDVHEADDFTWWKARLQQLTPYYHIYRIDHIIGFFRFWAIPFGQPASDGHYVPSEFEEWFQQGMKLMHLMLKHSPLLPIGEDLGDIPDAMRRALTHLGISGTKVIRWEREGVHQDGPYIPIDQYRPENLITVSTHDSEPLQLWWEEFPDESKAFCNMLEWTWEPKLSTEKHKAILTMSHHAPCLFHINPLQEFLAVTNLTRGPLEDERINKPGTVSPRNWSHRFLPTIDEMLAHDELTTTVKKMIPVT